MVVHTSIDTPVAASLLLEASALRNPPPVLEAPSQPVCGESVTVA
ncbi:hypothetical protein P4909_08320 [Escherichia coli]